MKQRIVFAMLMGIMTTGIISFMLISINQGFPSEFVWIWMKSWIIAYIVVIPVILILSPAVQILTGILCKDKSLAAKRK